jgi:plastocyanin
MWRKGISVTLTTTAIAAMSTLALATPSEASRGGNEIRIHDDCQPASFNAALKDPKACVGDGKTTFNAFLAEVTDTQQAEDWNFDPSMLTIRNGRPVILDNRGGETHTFTMVGDFGGGFVQLLNDLSGHPVPRPECLAAPGAKNVFVTADKEVAFKTAGLAPGKYKFQCCIHPWMQIVLTVK